MAPGSDSDGNCGQSAGDPTGSRPGEAGSGASLGNRLRRSEPDDGEAAVVRFFFLLPEAGGSFAARACLRFACAGDWRVTGMWAQVKRGAPTGVAGRAGVRATAGR